MKDQPGPELSHTLIEAIRSFPVRRELEHCNSRFTVSPFDIYARCPECGMRFKVRAYSAGAEIEDVFDAVLEWMNRPEAQEVAERRRREIAADSDE